MMEGGAVVVVAVLKDEFTLVGMGAEDATGREAALSGVVVVAVLGLATLVLGVVVEDRSAADGTKGLASTLRPDPMKVLAGEVKTTGCGTLGAASAGVDFARGAVASAGVLVIGVVVCESGVEPGEV